MITMQVRCMYIFNDSLITLCKYVCLTQMVTWHEVRIFIRNQLNLCADEY